jgi:hypothetical protein
MRRTQKLNAMECSTESTKEVRDSLKKHKQRLLQKNEHREKVKNSNTIASRMKQVVDNLILNQKTQENNPLLTIFIYKSQQNEIISSFMHEIRKENPILFDDREKFLDLLGQKYDLMKMTMSEPLLRAEVEGHIRDEREISINHADNYSCAPKRRKTLIRA